MLNNVKKSSILFIFFILASIFSTNANASKQCIYNNSGASINVAWKNSAGGNDKNASNANLTAGFQACQDNPNIGYAIIECNDCKIATQFTRAAIGIGGGVVIAACILVTAGECIQETPALAAEVTSLINGIHNGDHRKKLLAPRRGQTIRINGNAVAGLEFN